MPSEWSTGLIQFNAQNAIDCANASVCPCLWMQQISFLISSSSSNNSSGHTQQRKGCCNCWTPALLSLLIDIPVVFGCEICYHKANREWWILKHTYVEQNVDSMYESYPYNPNHDTQWNPSNSSFDWWIFDWLCFYCTASLQNTCTGCCCPREIHTANFPSAFACLVAGMYPACVCPLAFFLRQETKEKVNIHSENCITTLLASIFCLPCSLVQMKKTLEQQHY